MQIELLWFVKAVISVAFVSTFVSSRYHNPLYIDMKPFSCVVCMSFWFGLLATLDLVWLGLCPIQHAAFLTPVAVLVSKWFYNQIHS